jgi:hypothetical protein
MVQASAVVKDNIPSISRHGSYEIAVSETGRTRFCGAEVVKRFAAVTGTIESVRAEAISMRDDFLPGLTGSDLDAASGDPPRMGRDE